MMTRGIARAATAVVALLLGVLQLTPATAGSEGRRTYTGMIDGAAYKVEMPERWNGTLVLYSHPYYTAEMGEFPIGHAGRPETEAWLIEHGYALAASDFTGRNGFAVEAALTDQTRLLDWFETHIGRPRRAVATGSSMGAAIALMLAERNPDRFDGVLAMCGPLDLYAQWNLSLDVNFAIATLLAPGEDIDLVRADDPAASVAALQQAVGPAMQTPQGRARLALANAFANVPAWNSAHEPEPTELVERIQQLAVIDQFVLIGTFGPAGQAELARRAGGNPSYNTGVDYGRQLAQSARKDLVYDAYAAAGLDVRRDLAALAKAPRIAADPVAARYMQRLAVPRGTTPTPGLTRHHTGDAAVADHERWYAGQVRAAGDPRRLRQLFSDRASHCAFSAAEEIVALQALVERIGTGRWTDNSPDRMKAAAGRFGDEYQKVFDLAAGDAVRPPSFIRFTPPRLLRPSR
jgi:hypothetical protein